MKNKMKVVLISMPDVAPIIIHEAAVHMPNLGIASVGANIGSDHDVYIIDLIRKRRTIRKYLTRVLKKIEPDLVGLSAMTWQYDTCVRIAGLVKSICPETKIAIGGYHATLMSDEIARSKDAGPFDFIVRGEGEVPFSMLVEALAGRGRLEDIRSLSFIPPGNGGFVHNPPGELADLSRLKIPIRDKRRLTWGYHALYSNIEVMETSRGCTRSCNFCSIRHMYGRSFRTYPISRVLEDLDDIYYKRKCRLAFIADDNLVLDPSRVIELCGQIRCRGYKGLNLVVQADCLSMAKEEKMVDAMAAAGVTSVFLGIENVSPKNLKVAKKGNITQAAAKAVANCHKHGIMIIGGLIQGFPDDDEEAIVRNFDFLNVLGVDAAYTQILTPYPKTAIRRQLMEQGLLTNPRGYKYYSGLWANVKTKHLSAERLQYLFWLHKQKVLGWWEPSALARRNGQLWTGIWRFLVRPVFKYFVDRTLAKKGWNERYRKELERMENMNRFADL